MAGEGSSRIVLVSGPPGAGKTTLARPLAKALGFALISKDDIKEPLFDVLGGIDGDLESSRRIGAAAWEVFWSLARHMPRVVLEANFHRDSAYEREKIESLGGQVVEVYCRCPPGEVARRFAARAPTPERHRAHSAVITLTAEDVTTHFGAPIGIGTVIEADTSGPVDVAALARRIESIYSSS